MCVQDQSDGNNSDGTSVHKTINLCGETCPETFVRSKMELDELEQGERLEVHVDDPRSSKRVPRNMENHGQKHLSTRKESGIWKMTFEKQSDRDDDRWILME